MNITPLNHNIYNISKYNIMDLINTVVSGSLFNELNFGKKFIRILEENETIFEEGLIEKPKSLTRKNYLEIEKKFIALSKRLKMSAAELDLHMWHMKTGEVLK